MRKLRGLALLGVLAAATLGVPAQAEIVKTATVDCKGGKICFYWWPKLPELTGWHGDNSLNFELGENGSNVLIPDSKTFSNAPAVIYARAIYIERYDWQFKTKSPLASFIADDQETFRKEHKDIIITEIAPLKTGDGQVLKVISYSRPADKNWECVAYGEEDGDYLMFVLSANSEAGYTEALPAYHDLIARYKR